MSEHHVVDNVELPLDQAFIAQREADRAYFAKGDVPMQVSRRQLLTALVKMGLITGDEAKASSVTVPSAVQSVLDSMLADDKLVAEITWLNFTEAHRSDPLIAALAAANEMTKEDVDDFFRLAGSL